MRWWAHRYLPRLHNQLLLSRLRLLFSSIGKSWSQSEEEVRMCLQVILTLQQEVRSLLAPWTFKSSCQTKTKEALNLCLYDIRSQLLALPSLEMSMPLSLSLKCSRSSYLKMQRPNKSSRCNKNSRKLWRRSREKCTTSSTRCQSRWVSSTRSMKSRTRQGILIVKRKKKKRKKMRKRVRLTWEETI